MRIDRGTLLGGIGLLLVLSTLLVLPYLQFLLGAVILAFILRPVQVRLVSRFGDNLSASILVVLSLFAIVFPFMLVFAFVASSGLEYARSLEQRDFDFGTIEEPIADYTGMEIDLEAAVRSSGETIGQSVFDGAVTALETTLHLLIGFGLFLFLLFFFIRDAGRFVSWLRTVSPLRATVTDELLERIDAITRAVLLGHVLVAIIQGVVAGVGLLLVGIPNVAFWTFVMVLLALIPLIGTFAVWIPASLYLVSIGETVLALLLVVYGMIVVSLTDEYLRPVLVDRYAKINPGVIILGVFGGLSVFGFMGIFVGPIVVGALKAAIEVYDDHYGYSDYPSGE